MNLNPNAPFSWKSKDASIRRYCLQETARHGNEHLWVYDLDDGRDLAEAKGDSMGFVMLPPNVLNCAQDMNRRLKIIHTHPKSTSLSPGDLEVLIRYRGIAEIEAAGEDGSVFLASTAARNRSVALFYVLRVENAFMKTYQTLHQPPSQVDLHLRCAEAHIMCLALELNGVLEYHGNLSPMLYSKWLPYNHVTIDYAEETARRMADLSW